jgi:DNA-binding transcriptional MocR family regulator
VPDQATWQALIGLCDDRGLRLVSDEVHRGLELDRTRTLPQAVDRSATAVSINVLSKSYGLPGLRVGWVASHDHALLETLERHKHYTSICNAAPSEFLATLALRAGERIQRRNRDIVAANQPAFDAFFAAHDDLFDWAHPDGGCIAFPRYRGSGRRRGILPRPGRAGRRAAATGQPVRVGGRGCTHRPVPHRDRAPRSGTGPGRRRPFPRRTRDALAAAARACHIRSPSRVTPVNPRNPGV